MQLLPHRDLVVPTRLDPDEVRARLASFIGEGRPFSGSVGAGGFVAHRNGSLLRFGLPRVEGRFAPDGGGTSLLVNLRLERPFVALYLPWLTLMLAASAAFSVRTGLTPATLGPALLALLVHTMVHASFSGEAAIVGRYLAALDERPALRTG